MVKGCHLVQSMVERGFQGVVDGELFEENVGYVAVPVEGLLWGFELEVLAGGYSVE
jgi:hypothetical protein